LNITCNDHYKINVSNITEIQNIEHNSDNGFILPVFESSFENCPVDTWSISASSTEMVEHDQLNIPKQVSNLQIVTPVKPSIH
jgi:hypothetical protein